jgi:hypothetical protein
VAFAFQTDVGTRYPTAPVGDALALSRAMRAKYVPRYLGVCGSGAAAAIMTT